MPTTAEKAETLHRLHAQERPLVLVNAWDAGSARVLEAAGSPVIATTSAGIAWSLGHADGERLPRAELLAACARIARVVEVPLTVDIERGYGRTTGEVCDLVRGLIGLGAVGINIEDGLGADGMPAPAEPVCERIAALRDVALREGVRLFINARTDVYFSAMKDPARRHEEALRRARRCIAAGADGIFAPGLDVLADVARLAQAIDRPLNVYAGYPGVPAVEALAAAGVRRVSLGCGPLQAAYALLRRVAGQALRQGRYEAMTADMASTAELNRLFP